MARPTRSRPVRGRVQPRRSFRRVLGAAALAILLVACGEDSAGPVPSDLRVDLALRGLAAIDPATEGSYEAWFVDAAGEIASAGRFDAAEAGALSLISPFAEPRFVLVTIEGPGDADDGPSAMKLLGGRFDSGGEATLDVTGYLTLGGIPLEPAPGVHVLGTPSNDKAAGRNSLEDAGIWLADTRVDSTHASFFQTLTPLTVGWTYEGWVVRDFGTPGAVWVSYGQFRPNNLRKARFRDDTGPGPYSGLTDWEHAMQGVIHYPGEDWIANPHAYPVPGDVPLPFDLNGDAVAGRPSRWTHVLTIEPWLDPDGRRSEEPWLARPFFLRPYRNEIGEAPPDSPRRIVFHPELLPAGSARIAGPPR